MNGQLVFVYGTLRRGFSNHHLLAAARPLGGALTRERYALYLGEYPFLSRDQALCRVAGEVYEVSQGMLMTLDALEEHPRVYERFVIPVVLDSGREIEAWCYFHPAPRGRLISHGDFSRAARED